MSPAGFRHGEIVARVTTLLGDWANEIAPRGESWPARQVSSSKRIPTPYAGADVAFV